MEEVTITLSKSEYSLLCKIIELAQYQVDFSKYVEIDNSVKYTLLRNEIKLKYDEWFKMQSNKAKLTAHHSGTGPDMIAKS